VATAYDVEPWTDLFVASAGAGAALAGLVFVAVSINVERILSYAGLPERALATVLLLLSVVMVSLVALVPGQGRVALGLELLVLALAFAAGLAYLVRLRPGVGDQARYAAGREATMLLGTIPFVIGAISLLLEAGGGLYWIAVGILAAIAGGVTNAWVLLVEILR
jgi:modulator of FtsH protease